MKKGDWFLIGGVALLAVASLAFWGLTRQEGAQVTVEVDGQEVALQAPPALRDWVLAAGCQVFSDAWGLDCFCPFSPDGTSRDGWIVIP